MTERKEQNKQNQARFRQAQQQHYQRVQEGDVEFAGEPGMLEEQQQQQQQHQHNQQQMKRQRQQQKGAFNENNRHPRG